MQRVSLFLFLGAASLSPADVFGRGDGTFRGAAIRLLAGTGGFQNTISLTAGDFNRDGRKDLAAINGGVSISIALRGPGDRDSWEVQLPIQFGSGSFLIRAVDFDGDGDADLAVADPSSSAFVLWSNGDGTFKRGVRVPGSTGSRWVEAGDFDGDGKVDLASANWDSFSISIHRWRADGTFELVRSLPFNGAPHSLVAQDYSGDGKIDLLTGIDTVGILPLLGLGDGRFQPQKSFMGTGQCHRSIAGGDFDKDGLPDVVANCGVWLNDAGGNFRAKPLFPAGFTDTVQHVDVGDANGDGFPDVAGAASAIDGNSYRVFLIPGKGDGSFGAPIVWSQLGTSAGSFIFEDVDGDRFDDLIAATGDGTGLSVVWGASDTDARDWSRPLVDFGPAKEIVFADQDRDGLPDIWVLRGDQTQVNVYLSSSTGTLNGPSLSIRMPHALNTFDAADLDGNGILDLAGSTLTTGAVSVFFLKPDGQVQRHATYKVGSLPANVRVGLFDGDGLPDMVVPSRGSNDLAFLRGLDGGGFEAATRIPGIPRPKRCVAGSLDSDGQVDLVVFATEEVSVHFGNKETGFDEPMRVGRNEAWRLSEIAIADFDADGIADLIAADARQSSERGILLFAGRGNRTFAEPVAIVKGLGAPSLVVDDLDGNGFPDLTATLPAARAVVVILNGGPGGLAKPVEYALGFPLTGHKSTDLNADGVQDLLVYSSASAVVLFGNSAQAASFRRGDADGDGHVAVNDPIALLDSLFLGAGPVACGDGADADDSGVLDLADAIYNLNHQFLGGPAPPAPGPTDCGADETLDAGGNDLGCVGECK